MYGGIGLGLGREKSELLSNNEPQAMIVPALIQPSSCVCGEIFKLVYRLSGVAERSSRITSRVGRQHRSRPSPTTTYRNHV